MILFFLLKLRWSKCLYSLEGCVCVMCKIDELCFLSKLPWSKCLYTSTKYVAGRATGVRRLGTELARLWLRTQDFGYNKKATSPAATALKVIPFIAALPVAALRGVGDVVMVVFEVLGQVPLPPPNFASIQSWMYPKVC